VVTGWYMRTRRPLRFTRQGGYRPMNGASEVAGTDWRSCPESRYPSIRLRKASGLKHACRRRPISAGIVSAGRPTFGRVERTARCCVGTAPSGVARPGAVDPSGSFASDAVSCHDLAERAGSADTAIGGGIKRRQSIECQHQAGDRPRFRRRHAGGESEHARSRERYEYWSICKGRSSPCYGLVFPH
jgi:hypothetical protein